MTYKEVNTTSKAYKKRNKVIATAQKKSWADPEKKAARVAKMSIAMQARRDEGYIAGPKPLEYEGVQYPSWKDAMEATGLSAYKLKVNLGILSRRATYNELLSMTQEVIERACAQKNKKDSDSVLQALQTKLDLYRR